MDTSNSEPQRKPASPLIEQLSIAHDGDTKMLVGQGNRQKEFFVSSAILKMVSKVFAVCFEPGKFTEGKSREDSQDGYYHIAFPEDDAIVMNWVLMFIHYQSASIPYAQRLTSYPIEAYEVYQLASIAEKYFMWGPLTILYRLWMDRVISNGSMDSDDHLRLLTAATLARDSWTFKHMSRELILNDDNFSGTILSDLMEILPEDTLLRLTTKKIHIRRELAQIVKSDIDHFQRKNVSELHEYSLIDKTLSYIQTRDELVCGVATLPLQEAINMVEKIGGDNLIFRKLGWKTTKSTRETLKHIQVLGALISGLCLECTKEGEPALEHLGTNNHCAHTRDDSP